MEWLEETMNSLLNIYGIKKCAHVFGSILEEMPREETKVRPDSFIMDYITTLEIGDNLNKERGGKERAPPENRSPKRRALVVYGDGSSNAWNTTLFDSTTGNKIASSKTSIDLTKDDTDTSASTDTISQLSQDLAFLRKDFNESIQLTNKKRDEENDTFLGKISTLQKTTDTSIDTLTTFIRDSLTTQDKVITSLANGQASMDKRMETVTDNVQRQLDSMNTSLIGLQQTILHMVGAKAANVQHSHCASQMNSQDTTLTGTQTVPLGGLDEL